MRAGLVWVSAPSQEEKKNEEEAQPTRSHNLSLQSHTHSHTRWGSPLVGINMHVSMIYVPLTTTTSLLCNSGKSIACLYLDMDSLANCVWADLASRTLQCIIINTWKSLLYYGISLSLFPFFALPGPALSCMCWLQKWLLSLPPFPLATRLSLSLCDICRSFFKRGLSLFGVFLFEIRSERVRGVKVIIFLNDDELLLVLQAAASFVWVCVSPKM